MPTLTIAIPSAQGGPHISSPICAPFIAELRQLATIEGVEVESSALHGASHNCRFYALVTPQQMRTEAGGTPIGVDPVISAHCPPDCSSDHMLARLFATSCEKIALMVGSRTQKNTASGYDELMNPISLDKTGNLIATAVAKPPGAPIVVAALSFTTLMTSLYSM